MSHITGDRIRGLPAPVRRSLLRSGVVGRQVPARVDLRQRGQMLLRGRWLPFTAAESYTLDPPGFTWNGTVRMAGIPRTRARDWLRLIQARPWWLRRGTRVWPKSGTWRRT